jgi:hypothetical protein
VNVCTPISNCSAPSGNWTTSRSASSKRWGQLLRVAELIHRRHAARRFGHQVVGGPPTKLTQIGEFKATWLGFLHPRRVTGTTVSVKFFRFAYGMVSSYFLLFL